MATIDEESRQIERDIRQLKTNTTFSAEAGSVHRRKLEWRSICWMKKICDAAAI